MALYSAILRIQEIKMNIRILLVTLCFSLGLTQAVSAETLADIDAADGIDRDEANVIAREFFHRHVSACGRLSDPVEKGGAFAYRLFLGKKEKPGKDLLEIDKASGTVSMKEFALALDFADIQTTPPLETILEACDSSAQEEDILPWERWLQRERNGGLFCPPIDYYVLLLEEADYPPEALTLADHQRYDFCKYGNPATIFSVYTAEKSAKKKACAEKQLADVRSGAAYEFQELAALEAIKEPHRRFKIVSPHFAAVVYTTVYETERYDYWVDRSYEILRQAERAAVDCLYLRK
jgi:hypothetical protein